MVFQTHRDDVFDDPQLECDELSEKITLG